MSGEIDPFTMRTRKASCLCSRDKQAHRSWICHQAPVGGGWAIRGETWYLSTLHHNGQPRLVFNCSFRHQGMLLNDAAVARASTGPITGRSPPVILTKPNRCQQRCTRNGCLRLEDRVLLRFIWREHVHNYQDIYASIPQVVE